MAPNRGEVHVDGVALGLDARTGALVVYEPPGSRGKTVFAWPMGDKGKKRQQFSSTVVERAIDDRIACAAVFPGLAAGAYEVTSPWSGQQCRVTVEPGAVTEVDWR